jgi:hypothetical protein
MRNLAALPRKELQDLAKQNGIKANAKSADLVAQLQALQKENASAVVNRAPAGETSAPAVDQKPKTVSEEDPLDASITRERTLARCLLDNHPLTFKHATETLFKVVCNVCKHPDDPAYRSLRVGTSTFQGMIAPAAGGTAFLEACGFEPCDGATRWVLGAPDLAVLGSAKQALKDAVREHGRRMATAAEEAAARLADLRLASKHNREGKDVAAAAERERLRELIRCDREEREQEAQPPPPPPPPVQQEPEAGLQCWAAAPPPVPPPAQTPVAPVPPASKPQLPARRPLPPPTEPRRGSRKALHRPGRP